MYRSEICSICEKKVRIDKSHFCSVCQRRSHAKCNGIASKYILNVWLCKFCKIEMLPFSEIPDEKTVGNDLSYLKSYFKHLNSISDTYSNFNSDNDDSGYNDSIAP